MIGAFWIERCFAIWTFVIAIEIFFNRHFCITIAAQNSFLIKFCFRPFYRNMACFFRMTKIAWIVFSTTFEFNSDNIKW